MSTKKNFTWEIKTRCLLGNKGPLCADCGKSFGRVADSLCETCTDLIHYVRNKIYFLFVSEE